MDSGLAYAIGGLGMGFLAGFLCAVAWACSIVARALGEHPVELVRAWWRGR